MEKLILHLDLNNFYASVECNRRPEVRGFPVAVSGRPEQRHGVVLAKNEIAKKLGVKTGDTVLEAMAKAPGIIFIEPDFETYDTLSRQMLKICGDFTSHVEPFGADECWMDCTGSERLFGSGRDMADALRARMKKELDLTASVGVSFSKIFAKMGSDMKKPDATTEITRENYRDKIWPLAVGEMCGIGRSTATKLGQLNIRTLGQLARADDRVLRAHFGKVGIDIKIMANGGDMSGVREAVRGREIKSMGHSLTAVRDIVTYGDIRTLVYYLSGLVAARLKKHAARACGVAVHLRKTNLETSGKQAVLPFPVRSSAEIAESALKLIRELHDGSPLRSLGVSTFGIVSENAPRQLSFFDGGTDSAALEKLDDAVNRLNTGCKHKAVMRCSQSSLANDMYNDKSVGDFLPFKR